jgi:hypothetical protein
MFIERERVPWPNETGRQLEPLSFNIYEETSDMHKVEVLMVVRVKIIVFSDVTLCSLVHRYLHFGGFLEVNCCLHCQGTHIPEKCDICEVHVFILHVPFFTLSERIKSLSTCSPPVLPKLIYCNITAI